MLIYRIYPILRYEINTGNQTIPTETEATVGMEWIHLMDAGKETVFEQRRIEKSKDVRIQFTTSHHFIVLDEEGNQKYNGFIAGSEPDKLDYCKCKSFENGNFTKTEGDYITTHGYAFQCKHVLAARDQLLQNRLNEAFKSDKSHTERLSEN